MAIFNKRLKGDRFIMPLQLIGFWILGDQIRCDSSFFFHLVTYKGNRNPQVNEITSN